MNKNNDITSEEVESKSQRKRDMHALQALGKELVKLPPDKLATIELPETLRNAVIEARRIHQHGALKRQLQYIGKQMRDIDPNPIREQLATLSGHSQQAAMALHLIERWRDRLLEEGDLALEKLLQEQPHADRQYLRQLLRNAKKEVSENKPPKSTRLLFRYLRELMND